MTKQKQSLIISFLIGFAILAGLDQWTKGLAVQSLKGQKPFVIWNGVFEFYYSENRGAAFGMMQEKQLFFFLSPCAGRSGLSHMEDAAGGQIPSPGCVPDDDKRWRCGEYD